MGERGASPRELRGQIRDWRRGRIDTRWVDAFTDAYIACFAVVMLGAMSVNVVLGLGEDVRASCVSTSCRAAREILPLAAALGVLAAAAAVARLFGPLFSTPAEAAWLLAAPVDRSGLVRPRFLRLVAITVLVVGLLTAGPAGLAGAGTGAFVLAVASALTALAIVAVTAIGQVREDLTARVLTWLLAGAAWALLVVLAVGRAPGLGLPRLDAPWTVAIVATAVIASVTLLLCVRALKAVRRRALSPGGRLAPSISGALATLDLALLYDVLMARRWMGVEGVRPVRGGPSGPLVLVHRSTIRVIRSPQAVLVLAGSIVLPYAVAVTDIGIANAFVTALTCFLAGLGLLSGVRVVTRSASLTRAFPFADWALRLATLAVPGLLVVLAGVATSPALEGVSTNNWLLGLACGLAGLAAALRWVTGKPPDYSRPLVSTPAGGVPTNLYASAFRGFDILALTVAPVLLWPFSRGVEISVGLSLMTIWFLISAD